MKPKVTKQYLGIFIRSSLQRVMEVLFRSPEKEFSLSDIAKEAKVAKPHIGAILTELERLGFLTIIKLAKIWRIKANQSEPFTKSKIVYNLHFIYQSGLIKLLNDYFNNPKSVILFGSYRKGEDFSSSDIDIGIELEEEKEYRTLRLEALLEFERIAGRNIQLHLFNRKNVDIHVFNNIANGIVISGFLEVKP